MIARRLGRATVRPTATAPERGRARAPSAPVITIAGCPRDGPA